MQKVFYLNDEQIETAQHWHKNHDCAARFGNKPGKYCSSGKLLLVFTPNTEETTLRAKCVCGKTLDLGTV